MESVGCIRLYKTALKQQHRLIKVVDTVGTIWAEIMWSLYSVHVMKQCH